MNTTAAAVAVPSPKAIEALVCAGEHLIQALAAIGRLSEDDRTALAAASNHTLPDLLVRSLECAAAVAPGLRKSLRTHPPAGFTAKA
jgi:hypothetical protein